MGGMPSVRDMPRLDVGLLEWAEGLVERHELEGRMVAALEAQDLTAAKRLMAAARERIPELGVLDEFVKRTNAMIRTLSKEEALLLNALEVCVTMSPAALPPKGTN